MQRPYSSCSNKCSPNILQMPCNAGPQGSKGDRGEKGDRGDRGERGQQGQPGPQGIKGDRGERGINGIEGPRGLRGEKGDKGDKGYTGPQGYTGQKGDKGDTGDRGTIGPVGPMGQQGLQGNQGDTGDRGEQGERGLIGPIGPMGSTGPKGDKGDIGDCNNNSRNWCFASDVFHINTGKNNTTSLVSFLKNNSNSDKINKIELLLKSQYANTVTDIPQSSLILSVNGYNVNSSPITSDPYTITINSSPQYLLDNSYVKLTYTFDTIILTKDVNEISITCYYVGNSTPSMLKPWDLYICQVIVYNEISLACCSCSC